MLYEVITIPTNVAAPSTPSAAARARPVNRWLAEKDPKALMLVAPADHVIPDAQSYNFV